MVHWTATVASAINVFSAARLWPFNDAKFDNELGKKMKSMLQKLSVPVLNIVGHEDDI